MSPRHLCGSLLAALSLVSVQAGAQQPAPPAAPAPAGLPPPSLSQPGASPAEGRPAEIAAPAQPPAPAPAPAPKPERFADELVLATGRAPVTPPVPDSMRAQIHGEYQLRATHRTDLALAPPPGDPSVTTLGQKNVVFHWLRLSPRFDFRDRVALIAQIDVPRGFMLGERTQYVEPAEEPMNERNPMGVDARWLYLEARTDYGLWRVGQQGSYWGMGILANDGNHPSLFGDYRRGSIAERVMFATRPAGKDGPLTIVAAGDLVFRDKQADLTSGDRAWQGVLAFLYGHGHNQIGLYGVVRHQYRDRESFDSYTPYTETLDVRVADLFGRFAARVPGASAYMFGEAEGAVIVGDTSFVRNAELGRRNQKEKIQSVGSAVRLGAVHEARDGKRRWGDLALSVEWGFASGDANPNDGVQKRFTFEPNHKVGLVLFEHVLAWTTARTAFNTSDATLLARPSPGIQYYPSNGGVFGATYLYPTVVVRPRPWLDLKGALVLAQSTADPADPYQVGVNGRFASHYGGGGRRHDLGVEIDGGFEARIELDYDMTLQLGAQGGVLFPGHALDDAFGGGLANQYVGMGRLGFQF